jgi:hypothetical protein
MDSKETSGPDVIKLTAEDQLIIEVAKRALHTAVDLVVGELENDTRVRLLSSLGVSTAMIKKDVADNQMLLPRVQAFVDKIKANNPDINNYNDIVPYLLTKNPTIELVRTAVYSRLDNNGPAAA